MRKYVLRFSALGYLLVVLLGAALDGLLALVRPRRRASLGLADQPEHGARVQADADHHRDRGAAEHGLRHRLRLAIVRGRFRGAGIVNAIVDLPLALSPVVVGLSLFLLYGRTGWFGPWFERHGVQVLFSLPSMVIATIFVSLPFVAREVVPTLREIGDEQEQAAHTLGAGSWATFWRITLPSIRWAVIYGVVLTTARCLGEYGAVAVVSGRIEGKTETATLRVQDSYENFDLAGAYGVSLVLAVMSVIVLIAMTVLKPKEEA